ncbi:hypothetical protein P7K49_009313, partial [Saguinus oedipus]
MRAGEAAGPALGRPEPAPARPRPCPAQPGRLRLLGVQRREPAPPPLSAPESSPFSAWPPSAQENPPSCNQASGGG